MDLGKRLKEFRENKNISQVDLAKKLNITSQSLSQYELGKRTPNINMLVELADYFNVSLDFLIGRHEFVPICKYSDSLKLIIKEIDGLSKNELKELRKYISFLKYKNDGEK